ncbi:MAG: thioredoxin [Candidatus Nanohalobium sp.]
MPVEVDEEKMGEVKNSEETWVIDFWAEWCGPCKKLAPVFEEVSEEFDDVKFGKVNMEEQSSLGSRYGVRSLPTLIIIENGEEKARNTGLMTEPGLKNWIEENKS